MCRPEFWSLIAAVGEELAQKRMQSGQVFEPPFDGQAIFLSPHADTSSPCALNCERRSGTSDGYSRGFELGIVIAATRQYRPGDPRQLGGQRHDDNIFMRSLKQSARLPAQRRFALDKIRQRRSCAMDQVLAQIAVPPFTNLEEPGFPQWSFDAEPVPATPPCRARERTLSHRRPPRPAPWR